MAFFLSLEGIHRRDLDTEAKVFAALGQPVLMHGARPTRDQVHSSGPWDDPHLEWSTMPVSSRGPVDVGPGDATHLSSTPSTRTPAKTDRVIRCGSQTRLDMGPHSIPRGATYPASLKPPEPCQDPGPGRVDHLHHHAPVALCDSARNQGTPSWLHDSTSSTRVSGVRATLIRWKPSKPTSRSHRSQRSSDTQQQQVGPDTARGP